MKPSYGLCVNHTSRARAVRHFECDSGMSMAGDGPSQWTLEVILEHMVTPRPPGFGLSGSQGINKHGYSLG
jgi:hypothetical protein